MHWNLSITYNFTLDIKVKHNFANMKSFWKAKHTLIILTPSLSSRNWTMSKVYLSSSNPLKHTHFKTKITIFNVWHNQNSWFFFFFFEVLELQVSSRFYFVYECRPWYHTQLYGVTHNLTYKSPDLSLHIWKKKHLNT